MPPVCSCHSASRKPCTWAHANYILLVPKTSYRHIMRNENSAGAHRAPLTHRSCKATAHVKFNCAGALCDRQHGHALPWPRQGCQEHAACSPQAVALPIHPVKVRSGTGTHLAARRAMAVALRVARLVRAHGELGVARAILGALVDVGAADDHVLIVHDHHLAVHLRVRGTAVLYGTLVQHHGYAVHLHKYLGLDFFDSCPRDGEACCSCMTAVPAAAKEQFACMAAASADPGEDVHTTRTQATMHSTCPQGLASCGVWGSRAHVDGEAPGGLCAGCVAGARRADLMRPVCRAVPADMPFGSVGWNR